MTYIIFRPSPHTRWRPAAGEGRGPYQVEQCQESACLWIDYLVEEFTFR